MKVAGATLEEIQEAAFPQLGGNSFSMRREDVAFVLHNLRPSGHGYAFELRPWRRNAINPATLEREEIAVYARKRSPAACWHGHREFFRRLYKLAPRATVRTARAIYRNARDVEAWSQEMAGYGPGPNGDCACRE